MVIEKVSLTEIIAAARLRHASLVPESAGHLVLGILRGMEGRAVCVDPADVALDTDGHVLLEGKRQRTERAEAVRGVQRLLATLLEVSQGKSNGLRAVADDAGADLDALLAGVTRALIPINRGAAKRALARLARETLRTKSRGQLTVEDVAAVSPPPLPVVAEAEPKATSVPAPAVSAAAAPTPLPVTPSVDIDVALDEDWDDIDADIDLQTPTPRPVHSAAGEAAEPDGAAEPDDEPGDEPDDEPGDEPGDAAAPDDATDVALAPPDAADAVEAVAPPEPPPAPEDAPDAEAISEAIDEAIDEDPLVAEAKLAEKLIPAAAALAQQPQAQSPPPAFSKQPHEDGSVEALLMTFGESEEGDTVRELADSLKRMMALDPTPFPPDVDALLRTSHVFRVPELPARPLLEVVATPAPPTPSPASATPSAVSASSPVAAREARYPAEVAAPRDPQPAAEAPPMVVAAVVDLAPAPAETPRISVDFAPAERVSAISVPDLHPPAPSAPAMDPPAPDAEGAAEVEAGEPEVDVSPSPPPGAVAGDAVAAPPAGEDTLDAVEQEAVEEEDVAASASPPPGALEELTPTSLTPMVAPARRRSRWPLLGGALLVAGLAALAVTRHDPSWLLAPDGAAAAASDGRCMAEIRLKGLPPRHEVLALLGTTPLTTRPLPVGVRLELIATAPGHVAERMIIPADANWVEVTSGDRQLAVDLALEAGLNGGWPAAPPGDVGGIGPEGRVHATATPEAELWLVVAAGTGEQATIHLPCAHTATLLVVNPDNPTSHRRLSIAPKLLEAAAQTGGAELVTGPGS